MRLNSVLLLVSAFQLKGVRSFSGLPPMSRPPIKILAYGDSLTAGWHDDGMSLTPYAPQLQAGLEEALGPGAVLVRHKGLPGWTAESMVQAAGTDGVGLQSLLRRAQAAAGLEGSGEAHTITACVIIAGTNDLPYASSSAQVADAVLELHKIAHSEGVKTISVDIPPSAAALVQREYGDRRREVNEKLQQLAAEDGMRIHVACPVAFSPAGKEGADLWEPDGLHMSGLGYAALGSSLVPDVLRALKEWGIEGDVAASPP